MATVNPNPDLPEDLIYSIFLRLPVKALLRFKSVSKSLLSLISSDDFINTHLSVSTKDPHFTHHHLLLGHCLNDHHDLLGHCVNDRHGPLHYSTCSAYSLLNEPVPKTIKLDGKGFIDCIVGYCHGLVCYRSGEDFNIHLWNPSTRKSRKLPKLVDKYRDPSYGFGYDEFTHDYKVFAICGYNKKRVHVYSSKSDCWRMIEDHPFENGVAVSWGASLVNGGAIHWFVGPEQDCFGYIFIASLDIKTETFRKLLLPASGESAQCFSTFGENLAAALHLKDVIEIWVIENSGVCWKKLFTIPYTNSLTRDSYLTRVVCIYDTDNIMLISDTTIVLYNSRDKTFKYPLQLPFQHPDFYVHTYVESLVSPHVPNSSTRSSLQATSEQTLF